MRLILLVVLLAQSVFTAPIDENVVLRSENIGVEFDPVGGFPILNLPYGRFNGSHDAEHDIYQFKNIRFAEPPVGDLRWKLPQPPLNLTGIQDGSKGSGCVQLFPKVGMNLLGEGSFETWGPGLNELIGTTVSNLIPTIHPGSEDCLYLDVYIPGKILKNVGKSPVPVVNYIYGGAFTLGEKDQFGLYNPTDLIVKGNGSFIWVAGNYRLGIYGWMAGATMEKESHSNLGLYDQRMVLNWIQDFIPLLGGDKTNVIAMGESAGASSIMHHLIAHGGKQNPLFKRAIIQSPAFQIMWDRTGISEEVYKNVTKLSGCTQGGLDCLRKASATKLRQINQQIQDWAPRGSFGVGPASDGKWIRQLASVEYLEGAFWPGLESLIISHTENEATLFVDGHIRTDKQFTRFLNGIFPEVARKNNIVKHIDDYYPGINIPGSPYKNETQRVRDFIRDSSFTCNVRYMSEAYTGKTYNLQYNTYPGWHGMDLLATFVSPITPGPASKIAGMFKQPYLDVFDLYRSYIASYIVSGDPNGPKSPTKLKVVPWPKVLPQATTDPDRMGDILHVGLDGAFVGDDRALNKENCDFFALLEQKALAIAGASAPGSPPPKFDDVYHDKTPTVKFHTVQPFPADVPGTIPVGEMIRAFIASNYTLPIHAIQ